MDKRIIFAVAGSGKTSLIVESLDVEKRSLIVTYTNENYRNLEGSIIEKFGSVPPNITLMTYYGFLYSFCFRPFLGCEIRPAGICWDAPGYGTTPPSNTASAHYLTKNGYIYSNRIAKHLVVSGVVDKVKARLEKYFDNFFIDEVQDFAANDFNLLIELCASDLRMLFVGDFYQHTYDTSRDGNIRVNLHKDYGKYMSEFAKAGVSLDTESLNRSHRCSSSVCEFISSNIGIDIESHREDTMNRPGIAGDLLC